MGEVPDIPDEFDSEEEVKQYIDRLHDQIEFLEEELEKSEKNKLELEQELDEIQGKKERLQTVEDYLDYNAEHDLGQVEATISRLEKKIDDINLSNRGNLNGSVADTVSDITGEDYS
ncbi:hypothetical protein [Haloarcula litorea]|uniref:hypothetical protein n=1 Tax=Haloarcula litorea TaxID=3032579 RepID=UPI0023E8AF25|nr:hypothetical protein [Halomicroarcula sp. GDY20]